MRQRVHAAYSAAAAARAPTMEQSAAAPSSIDLQTRPLSSDTYQAPRMRSTRRNPGSDNALTESAAAGVEQSHLSTATSSGLKSKNRSKNATKRKTAGAVSEDYTKELKGDSGPTPTEEKGQREAETTTAAGKGTMPVQRSWVLFALASGCFAALNGAFAKLTTTALTSSLALAIHNAIPILPIALTETLTRAFFFGLNLISNGIMWALFTRALTAHPSATKVSLVNTSSNFLITALLGAVVFAENLKGLWWLGAAMLVLGNLVVSRGRGDDDDNKKELPTRAGAGADEEDVDVDLDKELTLTEGLPSSPRSSKRQKQKQKQEGERQALLAGDEVEGIKADGEEEDHLLPTR